MMESSREEEFLQLKETIRMKEFTIRKWEQQFAQESKEKFSKLPISLTGGKESDLSFLALMTKKIDISDKLNDEWKNATVHSEMKINLLGARGMEYLKKLEEATKENSRLTAELDQKNSELTSLKIDNAKLREKLEEKDEQLREKIKREGPRHIRRELQRLEEEKSSLEEAKNDACAEGLKLLKKYSDLTRVLKERDRTISTKNSAMEKLRAEIENLEEKSRKKDIETQNLQNISNQQLKEISQNCAKLEELQNANKDLEKRFLEAHDHALKKDWHKKHYVELEQERDKLLAGILPEGCPNCKKPFVTRTDHETKTNASGGSLEAKTLQLELDLCNTHYQIDQANEEIKKLKLDNQSLRTTEAVLRSESNEVRIEIQRQAKTIDTKNAQILQYNKDLKNLNESLCALKTEALTSKKKIKEYKSALIVTIQEIIPAITLLKNENCALAQEFKELKISQSKNMEELQIATNKQIKSVDMENCQERCRLAETIEALRIDLEIANETLCTTAEKCNRSNSAKLGLENRMRLTEEENQRLREKLEDSENSEKLLEHENAMTVQKIDDLKKQLETNSGQTFEVDQLNARIRALEEENSIHQTMALNIDALQKQIGRMNSN